MKRNVMSPNEKDLKKLLSEEDLFIGKGKGHRVALIRSRQVSLRAATSQFKQVLCHYLTEVSISSFRFYNLSEIHAMTDGCWRWVRNS